MDYALAKELKEAGYVFKLVNGPINPERDVLLELIPDVYFLAPTLEELIEACGDDFWSLEKLQTWIARNTHTTLRTDGSTATEAVARLWLALNKK